MRGGEVERKVIQEERIGGGEKRREVEEGGEVGEIERGMGEEGKGKRGQRG